MDDLDRLLSETMHGAAGHAPSGNGLLGTVHDRSRRYHRRRVATVAGVSVAVVLAAGIPFLTAAPEPVLPPAASTPAPNVTLVDGWAAPEFPYTLPLTGGMREPVVTAENGRLSAFFEATELRDHADVTVTVSTDEPAFTTEATETEISVRGHAGTLRTVDVKPARQLTLVWRESSSRWIRLATDDTYTTSQVVAIADSLSSAALPVQPPFALSRSPAGLVTDTVSASRMTFRAPNTSTAGFRTVLRERQPLAGTNIQVGGSGAVLNRSAGTVTLTVDVPSWNATLEVTVTGGLTISDTDLIAYAEGVRILNRSDPE
ncbi:MAG TPA: hypothetical protein VN408_38580 [Actinoplanes sp.]|nr:hypothetical protein [Actinoplanes sp.]